MSVVVGGVVIDVEGVAGVTVFGVVTVAAGTLGFGGDLSI